jgi:hypothetical protein
MCKLNIYLDTATRTGENDGKTEMWKGWGRNTGVKRERDKTGKRIKERQKED